MLDFITGPVKAIFFIAFLVAVFAGVEAGTGVGEKLLVLFFDLLSSFIRIAAETIL